MPGGGKRSLPEMGVRKSGLDGIQFRESSRNKSQESPRQTKPKEGSPFVVNSGVFLGKTSTIHIESWFKLAPRKVHELTFLRFGLPKRLLKKGGLVKGSAGGLAPEREPSLQGF